MNFDFATPLTRFVHKGCAALLLAGFLAGCSSAEPITRYYLLSDPELAAAGSTPQAITCGARLASTSVAPYLQRTHIMLATGSNELLPALQHRWSEPLEAGVGRLLASCLGGGAHATHAARVRIEHLHGSTEGNVVLQAQWSLESGDLDGEPGTTNDGSFSANSAQAAAGYDSLVSAQRELVLQLCADIRAALPACQ